MRGRGSRIGRAWPAALLCAALCLVLAAPAQAVSKDPLFTYTPVPPPGAPPPLKPPPAGYLEGPCGLAVDSTGLFYVSDHYHDAIDRFGFPEGATSPAYVDQRAKADPSGGPCALAIGTGGEIYVNSYHRDVTRYPSFSSGAGTVIDSEHPTGVAVDPATGSVYVDDGTHVSAYEASGAPIEVGGEALLIGQGFLGEGYGIAVSGYPGTEGFLYVPDAAAQTVKVFDPTADTEEPVAVIDGHGVPGGGFTSLRDAAIAVDDVSGEIYVADDLQPESADRPEAAIYVFDATGAYQGRLKLNIVDARPPGLAVDNSPTSTQGRVYLTSGNTEKASVIAYPPASAGAEALAAPEGIEALPPGGCACGVLPEPPPPLTCEGDSCQHLPSEPTDPTLNTLVEGAANPPVHFHDTDRLPHYRRLRHHHHARTAHHKHGGERR